MLTDASGREVLGGGGVLPVDVRALGAELRRLWESSVEAGGEGRAVTRACSRNVVALCDDDESAALAARVLVAVAERYPSRAFVVRRAAGPPDRLEATLEAQCLLRDGARHVCCEQINLAVGAAAGRRAASAIVPLLVPDLPVFVWVAGALVREDELLVRLLDHADRLLFDSRAAGDPGALLDDLSHREHGDRWSPADLEWARLDDWREAVAMLFDEPATAGLAAEVARVSIRRDPASATGAALLAGWILDRVESARGAQAEGVAARVDSGDAAGEESPIAVVFESGGPGRTGIEDVTIETRRPVALLQVTAAADGRALSLGIAAPGSCALPARLPRRDLPIEHLVETLLALPGADPMYEGARARAATFLAGASPE